MKKLAKILSLSLALVMCAVILTACGSPTKLEDMKKRYEDKDYKVVVIVSEKDNNETIKWSMTATPKADSVLGAAGSLAKTVTVTCYKNKEDAQKAYDALKDVAEENKHLSGTVVATGANAEGVKIAK